MTSIDSQLRPVIMPREILVFLLDQQRYALPSLLVEELARAVEIISVPGTPKEVEGVIDYRGKIVPVLDLRRYLGLLARAAQPADYLIILRIDARLFAIRVDRALEVTVVDHSNNEDTPTGRGGSALLHVQDGTVIVLNLAPLVALVEDASRQTDTDPRRAS
jgi:purine-binding chemotaxis protein CheW